MQRMLRFGGRGTVPGYEYRRFNGEQVAFVNLALSRSMLPPWLRLRGRVAIGWSNNHFHDSSPKMDAAPPV